MIARITGPVGKLSSRHAQPIGDRPLVQPAAKPAVPATRATWDTSPVPAPSPRKVEQQRQVLRAARPGPGREGRRRRRAVAEGECLCDPGPPPQMAWISVGELCVDPRYQREMKASRASRGLVHRIAVGWKWALFQPLTVALGSPADDGSRGRYAVIDGQHRLAAAKRRRIEQLPCYLIDAATVEAQAGYFVGLNRERKALLPTQLHRAAAVAGDVVAQRIERVCRSAGVKIGAGGSGGPGGLPPGVTVAVAKIRQLLDRFGEEPVTEGLRLLVDAAGEKRDQLKAEMIAGLVKLMAVTSWRRNMDRDKLARVLRVNSTHSWLFRAREHKREHGGSTSDAVAALIVAAYGTAK